MDWRKGNLDVPSVPPRPISKLVLCKPEPNIIKEGALRCTRCVQQSCSSKSRRGRSLGTISPNKRVWRFRPFEPVVGMRQAQMREGTFVWSKLPTRLVSPGAPFCPSFPEPKSSLQQRRQRPRESNEVRGQSVKLPQPSGKRSCTPPHPQKE